MSNPLDLRQFEHFLNFKSDDTGIIQSSEPLKFDASEFVITQDDKGYARDISFMAEEVSLEFYDGFFEPTDDYQLISGVIVDKASHALEQILRYNKTYGFQSKIEYILRRNGVDFILGQLNFEGCETDELTYFKCKIIQSTKRALARRREDVEIDVFSSEDLDGNFIQPLATENLLLQALPVTQRSQWKGDTGRFALRNVTSGDATAYYNNINQVVKSEIDDTLSYFAGFESPVNLAYVRALDDLTDVSIDIDINLTFQRYLGSSGGATLKLQYFIGEDSDITFDGLDQVIGAFSVFNISITDAEVQNINETFVFEGLNIPRDKKLFIFYYIRVSSPGVYGAEILINSEPEINVKGSATSIDTVVKVVKYIDLAKQTLKAINGMEIEAPDFDSDGEFKDLYALSGNLIRQRDDVPFYANFKDRKENLVVMNSDIQINTDDAFCLKYNRFYDNVENGAFMEAPSSDSVMNYNSRYAVNVLEWKFNNYEKDRDEENTLDTVHTESQISINNDEVKNTKKIDVKDIYDPLSVEVQRKQAFKETTALDTDNKISVLDSIPIAPGTTKSFGSSMLHQVGIDEDGNLFTKILKDANLPSWSLLGFNVGSPFQILSGFNAGNYIVSDIQNTILTLEPQGFIPVQEGLSYTVVQYPLENVLLKNRTNEGFTLIEGLLNPNNFSNLRYTIRRNLIHWESYISTCASYISENPKNTKFVNNGSLTTQFEDGIIYTEDGDIDLATIQQAILSPRTYNITVKASYDDVLNLISKYEDIATAGGFVRCEFVDGSIKKLYPSKLGYTWATESLNIIGEERFESDIVTVDRVDGIVVISDVSYSEISVGDIPYEYNEDFLAILDENKEKIINFTKYNKFVVQEETFDNVNDLAQALIDL